MCLKSVCIAGFSKIAGNPEEICWLCHLAFGRHPKNDRLLRDSLSNTYLGAQFRRLRTKLGPPVAIKAMAAKLALVYRLLRYGMPFIDRGADFYETQNRKLQINYLKRKAANLGFQIIEAPAA